MDARVIDIGSSVRVVGGEAMTELLGILRKIHAEHGDFLATPDTCLAMLREDAPSEAEVKAAIGDAIGMVISPVKTDETVTYIVGGDKTEDYAPSQRGLFAGACANLHRNIQICGSALWWYFHYAGYSGPEVEIAWAYKDGLKP